MNNNFQNQTHFVGVLVPAELTSTLQNCRDYMAQKYGCKSGYGTPIHITIIPPFALNESFSTKELVSTIRNAIEELIEANAIPFSIKVDGFDAFGDRTIFAKVEKNEKWSLLKNIIQNAVLEKFPQSFRKDTREFTPHLTVANRDIPQDVITSTLHYFEEFNLSEEFLLNNIAIFTKNKKRWESLDENIILFGEEYEN